MDLMGNTALAKLPYKVHVGLFLCVILLGMLPFLFLVGVTACTGGMLPFLFLVGVTACTGGMLPFLFLVGVTACTGGQLAEFVSEFAMFKQKLLIFKRSSEL